MDESSADEQPRIRINYRTNAAKALNELIGICSGIVANDEINIDELVYLSAWLSKHTHLSEDGDYIELIEKTKWIVFANEVNHYEIKDLLNLVQDILDYHINAKTPFDDTNTAIARLLGLCRGMLADDIFDDKEIYTLQKWMDKSSSFIAVSPIRELHKQVQKVLADGIITEEERSMLFKTMENTIGGTMAESGSVEGFPPSLSIE